MKRHQLTLLSVGAVFLVFVGLVAGVYLSDWMTPDENTIILPSVENVNITPTGGDTGSLVDFAPFSELEVTAENVKKLIDAMERPSVYSATLVMRTYWGDSKQSVQQSDITVNGSLQKIVTFTSSDATRKHCLSNGLHMVYWVENGPQPHATGQGKRSQDDLIGIPTYESILDLSDTGILGASYETVENKDLLVVYTKEAAYYGQYCLSMETGLLVQAIFYDSKSADAQMVYSVNLSDFSTEISADVFVLPDGKSFEEYVSASNPSIS